MIPLSALYDLLNHGDNSHLSSQSKFSIWQIDDVKVPEADKDAIIDGLVNSARASQDDCEYAEVLLIAGSRQANRNKLIDAQYFISQAVIRYTLMNDVFRGAVARLMLSTIQVKTGDHISAYANYRVARGTFEKILAEKRQALQDHAHRVPGLEKDVVWYSGCIDTMTDAWMVEPEDAHSWLSLFQESFLSTAARQLCEATKDSLVVHNYSRAYHHLSELQVMVKGSQDARERAEAYAFSGLTYYQMGNAREAEKYLRIAASLFPPDRHHQTVVRWVHAMVISREASRLSEAVRMCNDCVRCFEGLRLDAEHDNRQNDCAWYETQAKIMRRVIKQLTDRM